MIAIKRNFSGILIIFFTLALVLASLVSEFFQAPIISSRELSKFQFLFSSSDIENLQRFEVESELGHFKLQKEGSWVLVEPRKINANSQNINEMLDALKEIKIKRIFPKDQINLVNFSLDKPLAKLHLSPIKEKSKTLSLGLVNPIDNSTYISFENEDVIYHVTLYKYSYEKVDLSSLIDSRIFDFHIDKITEFKLLDTNKREKVSLSKKADTWIHNDVIQNEEKIKEYFKELINLRSIIILDSRTPELDAEIESYLKKPLYTISFKEGTKETKVEVSHVVRSLNGIKMEKRQNFIIRSTSRKHPFIVDRTHLKLFYKNMRSFKALNFKKLIY